MEEKLNWPRILGRAIVHLLGLALLTSPLVYIGVIHQWLGFGSFQPIIRGFFCDDVNLKHPFIATQQVTRTQLCMIWSILLFPTIIIVEILQECCSPKIEDNQPRSFPHLLLQLYRSLGSCIAGALVCFTITILTKFSVGRLRPHFLTVCPPATFLPACKDGYNYSVFVVINQTDCLVSGFNMTLDELREVRLSFMSAHSSLSFYGATFLVVYLQSRLARGGFWPVRIVKTIRPFIQIGLILVAFWISLTRVSDYFNHAGDVIMGAITGIIIAIHSICFSGGFYQTSFKINRNDFTLRPINFDKLNIKRSPSKMLFDSFMKPRSNIFVRTN